MKIFLLLIIIGCSWDALANPCFKLGQQLQKGINIPIELTYQAKSAFLTQKELVNVVFSFEVTECVVDVDNGILVANGKVSPYYRLNIQGTSYRGYIKDFLDVSYHDDPSATSEIEKLAFECLELRVHGATIASFLAKKDFSIFQPEVALAIVTPFISNLKKTYGQIGQIGFREKMGTAMKNGVEYNIITRPLVMNNFKTLKVSIEN